MLGELTLYQRRFKFYLLGLTLLCLASLFLSFALGRFKVSPWLLVKSLFAAEDPLLATIARLRLIRTLLAASVGGVLALAGAVFQALLRNPLAEPYTLGVSTGAAFGAALALFLGLASQGILPLFSLLGAMLTLILVIYLARTEEGAFRPATLILAGLVVSSFLSAGISLLKSLSDESLSSIVFWLLGSFSGRGSTHLLLFWPYALPLLILAFRWQEDLDLLALGDEEAQEVGVEVQRVRRALIVSACLASAACVAVSGVIGFVGLIVPHLLRLLVGARHRYLLPLCLVFGAGLLVWADVLARLVLPTGEELPIGVVTALLGAPFFAWLLSLKKKELEWLP